MNTLFPGPAVLVPLALGLVAGIPARGQPTSTPAGTNPVTAAISVTAPAKSATTSAPQKLDESAFRIIAERNIFNANRSGGRVQLATRRPARIETATLVGTMAYERGAFAFFEGSSSEFSKVVQANGVIAGHKLVDVLSEGVVLEADGQRFELPVGSQLRREDAGAWLVAEASGSSGGGSSSAPARTEERSGDSGSRNGRSSRTDSGRTRRSESGGESGAQPATPAPTATAKPAEPSAAEKNEILKRLKERREKE